MPAQTSNDTPPATRPGAAGGALPNGLLAWRAAADAPPVDPAPHNRYGLSDCGKRALGGTHGQARGGCYCDGCEGRRESSNAQKRVVNEVRRRFPAVHRGLTGTTLICAAADVYDVHHMRGRLWTSRTQWAAKFAPNGNPLSSSGAAARKWGRMLARWRKCGFRYDSRTEALERGGEVLHVRLHPDALALMRAVQAHGFDPDEDKLSKPRPPVEFTTEALPIRREVARLARRGA